MARGRVVALIVGALAVLAGCAEQSPEEKIAALRSYYQAEFNGFLVEEIPIVEASAPEGGEETAGESEGAPETMPVADVPVRTILLLDVLVQHSSPERLPGVTVDISMVDSQQQEKEHWRLWVETADLAKATHKQVSHRVEVDSYEEGDGFYAEVRHPIPPQERSEYREFAEGIR